MKSLEYHQEKKSSPVKGFFIGLNFILAILLLNFFLKGKWSIFFITLSIITLAQLLYWLLPKTFTSFALIWIKLTEHLSHFLGPLFLTLFYYSILTPYSLFYKILHRKKDKRWASSSDQLNFKDPF